MLPEYPYGTPDIYLGRALLFFRQHGIDACYDTFGYPDYGGLPPEISDNIGADEVDYIQNNWDEIRTCSGTSEL